MVESAELKRLFNTLLDQETPEQTPFKKVSYDNKAIWKQVETLVIDFFKHFQGRFYDEKDAKGCIRGLKSATKVNLEILTAYCKLAKDGYYGSMPYFSHATFQTHLQTFLNDIAYANS